MDEQEKKQLKAGVKTTEFWLSLAAAVSGAVVSSGLLAEGSTALKVAGLLVTICSALGYTWSRTTMKGQ